MSTLGKLCCFAATVLVLLSTTAVGVLAEEGETVADPDAIPAVQITTGSSHACALTDDGGVQCWGSNELVGWESARTGRMSRSAMRRWMWSAWTVA